MSFHPKVIYPYPTGNGFQRFSVEGMCPINPYKTFLDGLLMKFQESSFYTNILQFILVTFMYTCSNKGKFWKILFLASLSGVIGALIEGGTAAFVCREADIETPRNHLYSYLFAEIFWIIKEYSIPILNLLKIEAYDEGKIIRNIKIVIFLLFIIFVVFRFYIGYERMIDGILTNNKTKIGHMAAFFTIAAADLICTVCILYFVKKQNKNKNNDNTTVNHLIKRSSYLTLILVDTISIILAICNGITGIFKDYVPESIINPLQNLKCSFILIIACDTLLFKFNVELSSIYCNVEKNVNHKEYLKKNMFSISKSGDNYSFDNE
ncbi:hypothetical protein H8356DRAFT_375166 [Neocallimastix lanati (nom. inval.)]|uniref:Uncharacterized protein n=1 Tax=Neocallimastix californiae TaxID=1754190 RepID=A0A1Y1ZHH4_9FUNG|nr:hypothetical protein H8356DRAFT_375166 [Neocallimastix sp. JGI-2020a]ORY09718.1 hypothetical protein LY90DRAFT_518841 [Neocallimastix californiae]|eukprot:ORY09718.1 hypothetical protein LY90DRAFT_518841 [Neocallimastix californiae]